MSTDVDDAGDVERTPERRQAELQSGLAGENGHPVDALCTGCKQVRVKRAPDDVGEDRRTRSFKHICHRCRSAQWWNVIRDLDGLEDGQGGA